MRSVLSFILFLSTIYSVSAQVKQITVKVKSDGKPLDNVTVDIRTLSFTDEGLTGRNGEFSTSTNYSDKIIPGDNYTIYCYKKGYETMTQSGNIGRGQDDLIFDFDLKSTSEPMLYITGDVFDKSDNSPLEGVNILVETKGGNLNFKTGHHGEFFLELSPDVLIRPNELIIRLKKENYFNEKVRLNPLEFEHRIHLVRKPTTPPNPNVINYIPIAGNFYRDEKLSGWIYSIGLVSGIGAISYSNIRIPNLEEKALLAVSNTGRENYLAQAESNRNLRKGAYIFSGVLIGASLIDCIIKSSKINRQGHSSMIKNFQMEFGSEGIGLAFIF